jgi:hypothetical protein
MIALLREHQEQINAASIGSVQLLFHDASLKMQLVQHLPTEVR